MIGENTLPCFTPLFVLKAYSVISFNTHLLVVLSMNHEAKKKRNLHNQKALESVEVKTYTWLLFLVSIKTLVNNFYYIRCVIFVNKF